MRARAPADAVSIALGWRDAIGYDVRIGDAVNNALAVRDAVAHAHADVHGRVCCVRVHRVPSRMLVRPHVLLRSL